MLKDVLGNVLKAFSPSTDSGKALAASLGRLGDAFATFLSGLTGADGSKTPQYLVKGRPLLSFGFEHLPHLVGDELVKTRCLTARLATSLVPQMTTLSKSG